MYVSVFVYVFVVRAACQHMRKKQQNKMKQQKRNNKKEQTVKKTRSI